MSMALAGTNGDNETNIQLSKSLSISFYDADSTEIKVENQTKQIDLWISRDKTSYNFESFNLINATNLDTINSSLVKNGFILNGLKLTGSSQSIHVEIKPLNTSLIYLTLLKFGENPVFEDNNIKYDLLNVFCPSDLREEESEFFYRFFANMSTVNSFKGYVGISIIQINNFPLNNCLNKSLNTNDFLIQIIQNQTNSNKTSFSDNFKMRTYTSGCYYMNTFNNTWSSFGMEILSDSNLTHTHCVSNHLTTFAGGFIVLPNAIDFNYVWANASFLQNPVIYSTVIFLVCLYIIFGLWARWMDMRDEKKIGLTLLSEDIKNLENKYAYEILIFTGASIHAGTTSNVSEAY